MTYSVGFTMEKKRNRYISVNKIPPEGAWCMMLTSMVSTIILVKKSAAGGA